MNPPKSSTIGRFTGLSSVYSQLHNRDTFSVLNSIDRFAAKNKQVNPQPESRTIEQRKRDSTNRNRASILRILSLQLNHSRDRFSVHQFTQTIGFRQETMGQPHRTRIQDDWAVKRRNRPSEMHELNLGPSSILAVRRHLAAAR